MDKSPSPAGSPQDKKDAEAPAPQTLGKSAALPSGTPARALPEARASSRLCVITGLSGSGKSTAMQVFEDLMYFTVDGLPARMAPEMVNLMSRPSMAHFKGIALGLDIRQSAFLNEIDDVLDELRRQGFKPQLIFLEAETSEIMRRYATTRRPHPLEREGVGLESAVLMERKRLSQLRSQADMVINTTKYSIHDLRRVMFPRYFGDEAKRRILLGTFTRMAGYSDRYYSKAREIRQVVIQDYKGVLKDHDAVLAPTMPFTAPRFDDISKMSALDNYKADYLTVPANIAGTPHMSVPCGYGSDGMPIGMQFVADHWDEDVLFTMAEDWEKEFDMKKPEVGA